MTLSEFKSRFPFPVVAESDFHDVDVRGVTNDSRRVEKGFMFCAIAGDKLDGHQFIDQAVAAGAAVIVHGRPLDHHHPDVAHLQVDDPYAAYAVACEIAFGNPADDLTLIGVTGTNGKTSTAFLVKHILEHAGFPCGLISTVSHDDGRRARSATRTTPEPSELQALFFAMRQHQLQFAVMEVSSHALEQRRPGTATFKTAVFTNLTGDHLDYHGDMETYFHSKKRLFEEYLARDGVAVVNVDDSFGERLAHSLPETVVVPFGRNAPASGCRIIDFDTSVDGSTIRLALDGEETTLTTNLIGAHNAFNVAAAVAAANAAAGVKPLTAQSALRVPVNIPGRLQNFRAENGATIFVDYAHTDDALENVLRALRGLKRSAAAKLVVVFGCGGDRDRTKRPRMGAVAAELADVVVLTSDNPRSEDPMTIIDEIAAGVGDGINLRKTPDRRKAIKEAIAKARASDVILVAGKGHETYQEVNGEFLAFDDRREVQRAIGDAPLAVKTSPKSC